MASVILVHGIDNQRESSDLIESNWLPALAGGIRLAGREDLADRLWPPRSRSDSIDCRAAYYGHLFRAPDQQGLSDDLHNLSSEESALAEAQALEWLERIAERTPAGTGDAKQARFALAIVREPAQAQAQGTGNVLREVLKTLCRSTLVASMGMGIATRLVAPALVQVSRYLTDKTIRDQAQKAVFDLVTAETRAIIGHSLGSVVAYECAHLLKQPLPLLVTVGSPLGLRSIVTPHLTPPPSFPPTTTHWLNVANREDIIAAEPDLRPLFAREMPPSSRFGGVWFDEPSKDTHRPETYLGRDAVARAVIAALS